tara:strand:+ start:7537 stop:7968 length:432 start_codon:yes stop_codon:yes gene_type:complete
MKLRQDLQSAPKRALPNPILARQRHAVELHVLIHKMIKTTVDSVEIFAKNHRHVARANASPKTVKHVMSETTIATDMSTKVALNIHAKKRKKVKHNDVPSVAKKVSVHEVSEDVQTVNGAFAKRTMLVPNKKHATDLTTTVTV